MKEIGGVATIESLVQVWRKGIATFAQGTATIFVRIAADDVVESLAIGCRDILHIADILQTALNLKRGGTCLNQFQQVVTLVHILEGEQITVVLHFPTLAVDQRELHATELCTLPTIGRTSETILGGITET